MHRKHADFFSANLFYFIACYTLVVISTVATFIGFNFSSFTLDFALRMILIEALAIAVPPLFFIFFPYWRGFLKNMRLGRINLTILLIFPIGVVGYLFISYVTVIWMSLLTAVGLSPEAAGGSMPTPETAAMLGWSIVAIAVSPAVFEEFLFRGLIMPAYERHFRYPAVAIILSGVFFGLMHGQFLAMPGHITLGIVLGYIVIVTESLWAGILLHFIQNAMSMILLYLQEHLMTFFEPYLPGNIAAALISASAGSASGAMNLGESGVLIVSIFAAMFFGVVYFALMVLLYILYKRRNGKSPFAPRPADPPQQYIAVQEMLSNVETEAPSLPVKGGFLAWLPLLLTMPLILFEYVSSFAMMVPGFAEWLRNVTQNAGY